VEDISKTKDNKVACAKCS